MTTKDILKKHIDEQGLLTLGKYDVAAFEEALEEARRAGRDEERERIREYAKNDWVFPPPDITGYLHDGRAELPAEYVRRMVLTSLLPDKQRITD